MTAGFQTGLRLWGERAARASLHLVRRKMNYFVYPALLALSLGVWLPRLQGPLDLRWDGSVYYILGTSLAQGNGYRLSSEPGNIQEVQYPPLLPLVVAAHQWVLGTSDPRIVGPALRVSWLLLLLAYVAAVYAMLRRYLGSFGAFIGTVICLLHVLTFFMSDLLFPEVLYGLATVLFVLAAGRSRQASGWLEPLLATATFGLRTVGVALPVAWTADALFRRSYKQAALRFAIAALPMLCWQAYIGSVVRGTEYQRPAYAYQRAPYMFYNVTYATNLFTLNDSFAPEMGPASVRTLAQRMIRNALRMPLSVGEALISKHEFLENGCWPRIVPSSVVVPALIGLGALALGGLGLQLFRRQWLLPLYVLLSIAAICVTPWPKQFSRYFMPLAPFLALFLLQFLAALRSRFIQSKTLVTSAAVIGLGAMLAAELCVLKDVFTRYHQPIAAAGFNPAGVTPHFFFYDDSWRRLDQEINWLAGRVQPHEILAGSAPHWIYLRTGLKSVMTPLEPDPVKAQALLDSVPVTYLLLVEDLAVDTERYLVPVLRRFPEKWERVYGESMTVGRQNASEPRFAIYRRIGPVSQAALGRAGN